MTLTKQKMQKMGKFSTTKKSGRHSDRNQNLIRRNPPKIKKKFKKIAKKSKEFEKRSVKVHGEIWKKTSGKNQNNVRMIYILFNLFFRHIRVSST